MDKFKGCSAGQLRCPETQSGTLWITILLTHHSAEQLISPLNVRWPTERINTAAWQELIKTNTRGTKVNPHFKSSSPGGRAMIWEHVHSSSAEKTHLLHQQRPVRRSESTPWAELEMQTRRETPRVKTKPGPKKQPAPKQKATIARAHYEPGAQASDFPCWQWALKTRWDHLDVGQKDRGVDVI